MIEIICVDLDGTLLSNEKDVSKRNIEALRNAREKDIEVVLASGRRYASIFPYTEIIGFDCPVIAYSGSYIRYSDTDAPFFHKKMSWEYTVELIDMMIDRVDLIGFYLDDRFHIQEENERSHMYEYRTSMKSIVVPNLAGFLRSIKEDPTRVFILSETLGENGLYYELSEKFSGKLDFVSSWSSFLEAGALGVSKGNALKLLAGKNGWNLKNAVAFGDQDNDISAFEVCGMSYAMENATALVKEKADFVAPSNEDDGVAVILERLMR
ncbi:MAG: Cof-type HAD-IIB family hydrolase [Caldisericia bacterium]